MSHKTLIFTTLGYITIKKIDDYENIYSVNPLYLRINHANGYIEKRIKINIQFLTLQMKTKELVKNTQMFGIELKMKSKQ